MTRTGRPTSRSPLRTWSPEPAPSIGILRLRVTRAGMTPATRTPVECSIAYLLTPARGPRGLALTSRAHTSCRRPRRPVGRHRSAITYGLCPAPRAVGGRSSTSPEDVEARFKLLAGLDPSALNAVATTAPVATSFLQAWASSSPVAGRPPYDKCPRRRSREPSPESELAPWERVLSE